MPIFYLKVDGTTCMLVGGLQYALGLGDQPLRVDETCLVGTYSFAGSIASNPTTKQNTFK